MSTEFRTASTDEWAFVRWSCKAVHEATGKAAVDFGANHSRVFDFVESTETFVGEDGTRWTAADVRAVVVEGRATFGEFGGTFEVGSGDGATWAGF